MVLAGKIFKLREKAPLDSIAVKLRDFRREDTFEMGPRSLSLVTIIRDLGFKEDMLRGVFISDRVLNIFQRGEIVPTIETTETPFFFSEYKDKVLLLILEEKYQANRVANQLNEILFIKPGQIVEARIPQEVLRRFHEENPEGTKLIWFDNVDIPNISKLSLAGPSLADTALYADYCAHGYIWYVVFTSKKYGYVVGLTRNGIIALFTKAEEDDFVTYIVDEIFPLIE